MSEEIKTKRTRKPRTTIPRATVTEFASPVPLEIFETTTGLCCCGHTKSSHNGPGKMCSTFIGPVHGACGCQQYEEQ